MTRVFDAYAAFYDALYREKNYASEVDFILEMIGHRDSAPGTLVDLGCGTGAHAFEFVKAGYDVVGVDLSAAMIARAKTRAKYADRSQLPDFHVGDARSIRLGRKFDVATSLFHVASYQTQNADLASLFATAATHLNSGGRFFFDFWYGPGVLSELPETRIKRLATEEHTFIRLAEPEIDFSKNIATIKYTILAENLDGSRQVLEEEHSMRYLFLPEIDYLLREAGFTMVAACPWMKRNEPLERHWLACVLAEKS